RHLPHLHVAHVDMLDDAAAHRIVLEAQHTVQIRAVHAALLREHVADSTGAFAAEGHAAVPILHLTVLHHDVFAGCVQPTPVGIASALDGDAVVAGVEDAAIDQHVDAGFGVATVIVRAVAGDGHAADRHIFAEDRMHLI